MPFLHYLFEYATKRRQIRAMTRRKFSGEVLGTEEAGGRAVLLVYIIPVIGHYIAMGRAYSARANLSG
jgi:hypothetical protein